MNPLLFVVFALFVSRATSQYVFQREIATTNGANVWLGSSPWNPALSVMTSTALSVYRYPNTTIAQHTLAAATSNGVAYASWPSLAHRTNATTVAVTSIDDGIGETTVQTSANPLRIVFDAAERVGVVVTSAPGAVLFYYNDSSAMTWTEADVGLTSPSSLFGAAVALVANPMAQVAFISDPGVGRVHSFLFTGSNWIQMPDAGQLTTTCVSFGTSIAAVLINTTARVVSSCPTSTNSTPDFIDIRIYVFSSAGSVQNISGPTGLGRFVAMTPDGAVLAAASASDVRVYTWQISAFVLDTTIPLATDKGALVGISVDATHVAIAFANAVQVFGRPACGNQMLEASEACDGTSPGCTGCTIVSGWSCTTTPLEESHCCLPPNVTTADATCSNSQGSVTVIGCTGCTFAVTGPGVAPTYTSTSSYTLDPGTYTAHSRDAFGCTASVPFAIATPTCEDKWKTVYIPLIAGLGGGALLIAAIVAIILYCTLRGGRTTKKNDMLFTDIAMEDHQMKKEGLTGPI